MEILRYFDDPSRWDDVAKPENVESFSFGVSESIDFLFATLRLKNGEELIFTEVPISVFFAFKRESEFYAIGKMR